MKMYLTDNIEFLIKKDRYNDKKYYVKPIRIVPYKNPMNEKEMIKLLTILNAHCFEICDNKNEIGDDICEYKFF